MRKQLTLRKALLLPILLIALTTLASATPIVGSLPLAGLNTSLVQGTDLSAANLIVNANPVITSGVGTGNYSLIPTGTSFGSATLDILNLAGFSFSNGTYGSFAATGGNIVSQSSVFLNVLLTGMFTPGPGMPGLDAAPSTLSVTFTQTGSSVSAAYALETVPEPSTYALMGGGLLLLGFMRRRVAKKA